MPHLYHFGLLSLVAMYLSIVVHEVGHAIAGWLMGFVVTSLGVGTARPVLILPIGRTRFYLGLSQPFQGITFAFLPRHYPGWRRMASFIVGGMAANALCAVLSLGLARGLPIGLTATFFRMFAGINALVGALSLLPIRVNVGRGMLQSDGGILLEAIRSGSMTQPPPDVIQAAAGCRPLWQSIGDRRMNRLYTLYAASSWLDLGSVEKAESLFAEAIAIDGQHPHIDWFEAFIRANLALARGEVAEARVALEQVERLTDPASSEGRYLLALLRANLLQIDGEPGQAYAAFQRLALDPVGERCPDFSASALTSQLRAACIAGNQEAVVSLRERFDNRQPLPSGLHNLHFYGVSARFASARGDDARHDYHRALKAIAALAAPWRDPGDKAAFIEAQRELIEESRRTLDAEKLAPLLEVIESRQTDAPLMARNEVFRWWSLRLMLINVVSFVPLVLLSNAMGQPQGGPAMFLAVMLAFFTLLGAFYLAFDFTAGKLLPSLMRLTGFILLALAITPWVGGVLFGFSAIFGCNRSVPDWC